jgi:hypothetical protein
VLPRAIKGIPGNKKKRKLLEDPSLKCSSINRKASLEQACIAIIMKIR